MDVPHAERGDWEAVAAEWMGDIQKLREIAERMRNAGIRFGFFVRVPATGAPGGAMVAMCADEVEEHLNTFPHPPHMPAPISFCFELLSPRPEESAPSAIDEVAEHDLHVPPTTTRH